MSRQFLDSLAQIYLALPRLETEYCDWPGIVKKSLRDLADEQCWSTVRNVKYLNACVGDTETPPESMVQLSVLLPMLEYADWTGQEIPLSNDILKSLPKFFDDNANVYGRWLRSEAHELDGSEEHKKPRLMDSWYLYHSLLKLSRLALRGNETAKKLFLDSLDYAVQVARKFKYQFPIFYDLDTMKVIKAESREGQGGENDVAGQYAHLMMQAWDLTKEERYLEEARKAAKSIQGLGFNMMYQAQFFVRLNGVLHATPLFVTLLFVEVTDVIFAVDSVPAIYALTGEPLIVFVSNVFAILGLRALYFLLAGMMDRFYMLKYGLAVVLIFVGLKIAWLNDLYGGKFPITISLGIIAAVIAASVIASLLFPKVREVAGAPAGPGVH